VFLKGFESVVCDGLHLMKVRVNGKETVTKDPYLLSVLVADLGISGRFAIEINGEIVPRRSFDNRLLRENDRVEIVKAVGGG
jgi:thiamine biosynthesis protein ThiS